MDCAIRNTRQLMSKQIDHMDHSRYYDVNLPSPTDVNPDRGDAFYRSKIAELYQKCINHQSKRNSLYIGDLGRLCYLPYRLVTSKSFALDLLVCQSNQCIDVNDQKQIEKAKWDMLTEALSFAQHVREQQHCSTHSQRVSLLEGELVGALVMIISISNAMLSLVEDLDIEETMVTSIKNDMKICKDQLLTFCLSEVMHLPPSECEVLYGRAGYLKAIAFVRKETSDPKYGMIEARMLVGQIWNEGKRFGRECSSKLNCDLPLMWEWHSSLYLGAAHGVTGIIHALLDFLEELTQVDPGAWNILEHTIAVLNEFCWQGNLASSISKSGEELSFKNKANRLVQFCHGAPGHALLLLQMYNKTRDTRLASRNDVSKYLRKAQKITKSVILPKGLLKKGVGLCHGISGNAYCFLGVHHAELSAADTNRNRGRHTNDWLKYSFIYANFALDNLEDLEDVPDRPYSLYEGLVGLVCFLLDLVNQKSGVVSSFPCFEF